MSDSLKRLIEAVKEQGLTRTQLENYRDEMTSLFGDMALAMADCEKAEAVYFIVQKNREPDKSDVAIKRLWNVTEQGQRQIDLKHGLKALEKLLSSIRSRIFSIY